MGVVFALLLPKVEFLVDRIVSARFVEHENDLNEKIFGVLGSLFLGCKRCRGPKS
jgi:hypothetical protein